MLANDIRLGVALHLLNQLRRIIIFILLNALVNVALALEDEAVLAVFGLDDELADEYVRLEAGYRALAVIQIAVVARLVKHLILRAVQGIEIFGFSIRTGSVLDDILSVNDGEVEAFLLLGSFALVLGSFECKERRGNLFDDDGLFLALRFCGKLCLVFFKSLCELGRRSALIIAAVLGIVVNALVLALVA